MSTVSLCGLTNIPAPKLFSSLPDASNWKTGLTLALGPPQVVPPAPELPHRSATQMVPSGAVVTLAVDPHFLPFGQLAPVDAGLIRIRQVVRARQAATPREA